MLMLSQCPFSPNIHTVKWSQSYGTNPGPGRLIENKQVAVTSLNFLCCVRHLSTVSQMSSNQPGALSIITVSRMTI